MVKKLLIKGLLILTALATLSGCGELKMEQDFDVKVPGRPGEILSEKELERVDKEEGTAFGNSLDFLFGDDKKRKRSLGPAIEVSALLWRASLDTISFMPLKSADPFGGVIITDWYVPPETPNERLKLTVYILSRQLRSDGIRVSVFRETLKQGVWRTATVSKETVNKLENKILYRARELRIASKKNY